MNTIKPLEWRYATKHFDPHQKLSANQLTNLLNTINLAPSSYGLQPYQVVVIEDVEIRKQLKEVCFQQPQITEASQVIIFATHKELTNNHIDEFMERIAKSRNMDVSNLSEFKGMVSNKVNHFTSEERMHWSAKQCYIALGFLLYTSAQMGIDACPMEGFLPAEVDKILGLEEKNLKSVVMATVGFRADKDKYQHLPKVRKDLKDLIITY
jgi:nitroreductase